jgi:S1-C subfamily serine protease
VHIGATAFLGVGLLPSAAGFPGSTGTGATVVGVAAGSPAARAGLTAGDGRA